MLVYMLADTLLQLGELLVEKGNMLRQRLLHRFRRDPCLLAIDFLLADGAQVLPMPHHRLQLALLRRRWGPLLRILSATEIGDQDRVEGIGFVAAQARSEEHTSELQSRE